VCAFNHCIVNSTTTAAATRSVAVLLGSAAVTHLPDTLLCGCSVLL
jgi:hypothetical protein